MDHLNVVTGTLVTDPVTAGLAVALGSDALENVLNVGPSGLVTTGHERGSVTGTLLTTGDTTADEADALAVEVLSTAVAVGEVGVTTVNDDITLLEERQKGLDEVINGFASHDEEHDTAGALELGAELLDGVSTNDGLACFVVSIFCNGHWNLLFSGLLTLSLVRQEVVNLGDGAVESADGEAVISNVQDEVLAHNGQTDEAEVSTRSKVRRSTDIDAGETGAIVSEQCLLSTDG